MKTIVRFGTLLALLFALIPSARPAGIDGKWTAEFDTQVGVQKYVYEFKTGAGGMLTGRATFERRDQKGEVELKAGKVAGDTVSFSEPLSFDGNEITITYTGKLAGDEMKLKRVVGNSVRSLSPMAVIMSCFN